MAKKKDDPAAGPQEQLAEPPAAPETVEAEEVAAEPEPAPAEEPAETIEGEAVEESEPEDDRARVEAEIEEAQTKAIALRESAPSLLPTPGEFAAMEAVATRISNSSFVPKNFRGKPEEVMAAILFGREIGIGPMQSLKDISIIDGRPSLAAHLLMKKLREGGIMILESESTATRAWIKARRRDTGEVAEIEWTIEEAERVMTREHGQTIKLSEKSNWRSYPADMLWARVVGRLSRRLGSDLLGASVPYATEEVMDFDDSDYATGRPAPISVVAPARGWRELAERLGELIGFDEAVEWVRQALAVKYAVSTARDLDEVKTREASAALNTVLADLTLYEGDLSFDPNVREVVAASIEKRLGVKVDGPEWRLAPTETDREPKPEPEAPEQPADAEAETQPTDVEVAEGEDPSLDRTAGDPAPGDDDYWSGGVDAPADPDIKF